MCFINQIDISSMAIKANWAWKCKNDNNWINFTNTGLKKSWESYFLKFDGHTLLFINVRWAFDIKMWIFVFIWELIQSHTDFVRFFFILNSLLSKTELRNETMCRFLKSLRCWTEEGCHWSYLLLQMLCMECSQHQVTHLHPPIVRCSEKRAEKYHILKCYRGWRRWRLLN